jgi:subtilisin-like proprotein convertase family protein
MSASPIARLGGLIICCLFAVASPAAFGQSATNIFSFTNLNMAIPDDNPNVVQNSQIMTGLAGSIAKIQVTLDIAGTGDGGAFNGDYYVALVNSAGGFAVLLNRAGMSSENPYGYGDDGFNVTFSDSAPDDIHLYQNYSDTFNLGGQLTGVWQPDGENISPLADPSAFDAALSQQTAMLSSFDGGNPDGTWTLFLADLSEGGTGQLVSWSLDITTVPEPAGNRIFAVGFIASLWFLRRRK